MLGWVAKNKGNTKKEFAMKISQTKNTAQPKAAESTPQDMKSPKDPYATLWYMGLLSKRYHYKSSFVTEKCALRL
jgi:hypothetical protein